MDLLYPPMVSLPRRYRYCWKCHWGFSDKSASLEISQSDMSLHELFSESKKTVGDLWNIPTVHDRYSRSRPGLCPSFWRSWLLSWKVGLLYLKLCTDKVDIEACKRAYHSLSMNTLRVCHMKKVKKLHKMLGSSGIAWSYFWSYNNQANLIEFLIMNDQAYRLIIHLIIFNRLIWQLRITF